MVADNANATCHFYPVRDTPDYEPGSVSSSMYEEDGGMRDLFDFTIYMDRVGALYLSYGPSDLTLGTLDSFSTCPTRACSADVCQARGKIRDYDRRRGPM